MEVIRILDLRQYDRARGRFRDTVYGNSRKPEGVVTPDGKGGFSVIDPICACKAIGPSDCVCEHIRRFYPSLTPQPCGFVAFNFEEAFPVPQGGRPPVFIATPSNTGDECHGNVHHISDDRLKKVLRTKPFEGKTHLCVDGRVEPYTHERAVELVNAYFPDPE
jgi:hypothetical protein